MSPQQTQAPSGFGPGLPRRHASSRRGASWAYGGLLTLLVLGVYHRAPSLGFVFDDPYFLRDNPFVGRGLTLEGLRWALTASVAALWHPVTLLSHMIDVQLFGMRAGAHHVVNVLLHVANTLLLFGFLAKATGAPRRSAFVAALFAVHPLHVEVVAWVSERKELLSTFFALLALHAYRGFLARGGAKRYLAAAFAFAAGLASKPTLVTLPFVLLLLDFWPFHRRLDWRALREKLPLLALSAAASAIALLTQRDSGATLLAGPHPLAVRAANAAASYLAYLGQSFWPTRLAVMYPHPGPSLPAWEWVLGAAVVALSASLAIFYRRRHPWLTTGTLWFLGTLVPVIGLVQVGAQAHADRYTYVPLVGLFLAIAWIPPPAGSAAMRRLLHAGAYGAILACAVLSARQVPVWTDNRRLYEHALEVAPGNWMMHGNLVTEYVQRRDFERAVHHARELVRLRPDFAEAHFNLAWALEGQGLNDQAIEEYRTALRLNPGLVAADRNLGLLLQRVQRFQEAIPHLSRAGLWFGR